MKLFRNLCAPILSAIVLLSVNPALSANGTTGGASAAADGTTAGATAGDGNDTISGTTETVASDNATGTASTARGTTDSTSGGPSQAPKQTTLKGGVDHAEVLPDLGDNLKEGRVYSDDLLPPVAAKGNNEWFYIPPWYAGTKHTEEEIILYRYDYQTGEESTPNMRQMNRQDSRNGFQIDANGGIWDYKQIPSIRHVESDFCDAILYLQGVVPITGNDSQLVLKYNLISVSIDKRTKKILKVVQQEQINTVTSPRPGVLRTDASVKAFAADGKPLRQEQSVMMAQVVEPFEKTDTLDGKDLKKLFHDYLVSHQLEKLVPKDLAKSTD